MSFQHRTIVVLNSGLYHKLMLQDFYSLVYRQHSVADPEISKRGEGAPEKNSRNLGFKS
jgi:hypothetical protein